MSSGEGSDMRPRGSVRPSVHAGAVGALLAASLAFAPQVASSKTPTLTSLATVPELNGATSVVVDGDHAYVSYRGGLAVVDISDPAAPEVVDREPAVEAVIPEESIDLGPDLLIAGVDGGCGDLDNCALLVFDRSDPASLELLSSIDLVHHNSACVASCRYVYTDDGDIVDLTDPAAPVVTHSEVLADQFAHSLAEMAPGLLLTLSTWYGLAYLDVTDPLAPVLLHAGEVETPVPTISLKGNASDQIWVGGPQGRFYVTSSNLGALPGRCPDGAEVYVVEDPGLAAWLAAPLSERGEITFGPMVRSAHAWGGATTPRTYIDCTTDAAVHPVADGQAAMVNVEGGIEVVTVDGAGVPTVTAASSGPRQPVGVAWVDETLVVSADAVHGLELLRVGE